MRKLREIFLKAALIAAAVITGGILLFLIGIILKRGLPQLSWSFLTTATSYLAGTTGILPNICNTLYLILIAMGAALPLGVGAAVYITEYAENPRVVRLISFAAETLTGIPSILFGLIGMLFFIKFVKVNRRRNLVVVRYSYFNIHIKAESLLKTVFQKFSVVGHDNASLEI
mgnify:CR=1 FL=1